MDELFGRKPDVADPDIDIDKPLVEPKPRVPNPFEGDDDETLPMPGPKMRKKHQELTFGKGLFVAEKPTSAYGVG